MPERERKLSVDDVQQLLKQKRAELVDLRKQHQAAYSTMCGELDKAGYRTVQERANAIKPYDKTKKDNLAKAKSSWESATKSAEDRFGAEISRLKVQKSEELVKIDAEYREARVRVTDEFVRVSEKLYAEYTEAVKRQNAERREKLEDLVTKQAQELKKCQVELGALEEQFAGMKRN